MSNITQQPCETSKNKVLMLPDHAPFSLQLLCNIGLFKSRDEQAVKKTGGKGGGNWASLEAFSTTAKKRDAIIKGVAPFSSLVNSMNS